MKNFDNLLTKYFPEITYTKDSIFNDSVNTYYFEKEKLIIEVDVPGQGIKDINEQKRKNKELKKMGIKLLHFDEKEIIENPKQVYNELSHIFHNWNSTDIKTF
ncbi:MAG: DUF559 domain-containing protein [Bacteroidota bacterium]|nr:DUF559 domain-containing protein [Bacteroidota bacterium]